MSLLQAKIEEKPPKEEKADTSAYEKAIEERDSIIKGQKDEIAALKDEIATLKDEISNLKGKAEEAKKEEKKETEKEVAPVATAASVPSPRTPPVGSFGLLTFI